MKKYLPIFFLVSCTSIEVREVDPSYNVDHVCIEDNPKVIVADFVNTIEDVFNNHGITTEVVKGEVPERCTYRLRYTALRSWDITPYLSHAEFRLYKGKKRIGSADYHLKGKGGFDFSKWASVESKMTPVLNKMLVRQNNSVKEGSVQD